MQIKSIQLPSGSIQLPSGLNKVALAALCSVLIVLMLVFCKWAFGHAVALNATELEVAALGAGLASNDPHAHYSLARQLQKTLLPGDEARALRELETTVSLSPSNYEFWLALGRAREQAGDAEGAEQALRKAKELAPNYSRVRWALGNALLRQDRQEEAFAEIREAVAADVSFAAPAANAAWQIFDGDIDRIRRAIGDSPRINASIAVLLANDKRYVEAAGFWGRVPADTASQELKEPGQALYNKLVEGGFYRSAIEVGRSVGAFAGNEAAVGTISNGGFEQALAQPAPNAFSWAVEGGAFPAVGLNESQKHGGSYSLLMRFGQGGNGFRKVSQKIGVDPSGSYELRFFYYSDLTTNAKLRCDIFSAGGAPVAGAPIAAKQAWQEVRVPFTLPADVEGVEVRISSEACPGGGCTTSGNIWFDDFALIKN